MNNEKEIERMKMLLVNDIICGHDAEETAEHLAKYGIGDKKQAVKEFIRQVNDELENAVMESSGKFNDGYNDCIFDTHCLLDNIFKRIYGDANNG